MSRVLPRALHRPVWSGSGARVIAIALMSAVFAVAASACFVLAEDPGAPEAVGDDGDVSPDVDAAEDRDASEDSDTTEDPDTPSDADVPAEAGDAGEVEDEGGTDADLDLLVDAPDHDAADSGDLDTGSDPVDADASEVPDASDGGADVDLDVDVDVGCTLDDDCDEGQLCGPAGCQEGVEGDPCGSNADCALQAPFCGATSTCHDGSLDDPCASSEQCVGTTAFFGANECGGRGCRRPDFRLVEPPASFFVGCPGTAVFPCPPGASETVRTQVTLTRDYYVQTHEVTQSEWYALLSQDPSLNNACDPALAECRLPVERVNWYEAMLYANTLSTQAGLETCYDLSLCTGTPGTSYSCNAGVTFAGLNCRGYRLPVEAEWELMARGGTTTDVYSGNLASGDNICTIEAPAHLRAIAWFCATAATTQLVSGLIPNAFGLYDAAGNVREWVWDTWEGAYPPGPLTDPLGATSGNDRITRGGDYTTNPAGVQHGARYHTIRATRSGQIGFRLVRTAPRE